MRDKKYETAIKNLLIIAYDFPPIGGSGIHRTLKYIKYLPRFGWNPIVLTVNKDPKNLEYTASSIQEDFLAKVPIYRSSVLEPYSIYRSFGGKQKQGSRQSSILHIDGDKTSFKIIMKKLLLSLLIPDYKIGWYPAAVTKAKLIFNEHYIDAIYSTSPKNTAHLVARYLSRKYGKPWIADFRDPWPPYNTERLTLLQKLNDSMEKKVLSDASKITVAWPGILDDIKSRYRDFDTSKATLINNGFDEDDFIGLEPKKFGSFTISHAGIFYRHRTPESLFRGLGLLLNDKPQLRKNIKLLFIGITDPTLMNLIDKYQLSDVVDQIPFVSHRECLNYLSGSNLLFLNSFDQCVPGKLFEYIGLKKPILALVEKNTLVANIVNSTKSGIVINPENTSEIKNQILLMYHNYRKGILKFNRKDDRLMYRYERKTLTQKLAKILDDIT